MYTYTACICVHLQSSVNFFCIYYKAFFFTTLYFSDECGIIQVTRERGHNIARKFKWALTGAYLAVPHKPAEHSMPIIFLMNSVKLLKIHGGGGGHTRGTQRAAHKCHIPLNTSGSCSQCLIHVRKIRIHHRQCVGGAGGSKNRRPLCRLTSH